jgi:hypothetical protein
MKEQDMKSGPPGENWYAIKNAQGHFSEVYSMRAYCAIALNRREDRASCKIVRVRITEIEEAK